MTEQNKLIAQGTSVRAGSWGNLCVAHAQVSLNGFLIADTVDFFVLPRSSKVYDCFFIREGNATAASTMKLGLKAVSMVGAGDDDDYFAAATALDAAGLSRKVTVTPPKILDDDDYYVQGTLAGANIGAHTSLIDVVVLFEFLGNK